MIGRHIEGFGAVVGALAPGTVATLWRVEGPAGAVVLKVVPAESGTVARRFERERDALSKLPVDASLPRLLDARTLDDGTGLLVETLAPGESLRRRLMRDGPPGTRVAIAWVGALAAALDRVHGAGLVHCDVKPENVVIDGSGAAARLVLVDFGLATATGLACLAHEGATAGTPRYMPPEQVRGTAVDARSDVYALGLVAYELLTGEPPFMGSPNVDVRTQQLQSQPVPPSVVAYDGEVPESASEVVLQALSKAPERRFSSAGAFARALSDALG